MLDYECTCQPFDVQPERARPYPEVAAVLDDIVAVGGTRVVIVSGRPAAEVPPLLKLASPPEIWGSHGWERLLPDGRRVIEQPTPAARKALADASGAIEVVMPPGARLEHKLASIALHWRALPPPAAEDLGRRAREIWQPMANGGALELLPFDGGL